MISSNQESITREVSRIFGWIYVLSWSLSFYPQPIKNCRRRTTAGTTSDFPTANVLGFLSLTISNGCLLYNPTVRAQYAKRHPRSPDPTVRFNDFMFALHALILCAITWSQYMLPRLWRFNKAETLKTSMAVKGVCFGGIGVVLVSAAWVLITGGKQLEWLDVIYITGYFKLVLTFLKYLPQVILNHRRRSTAGWSIDQILLDFLGGILSLAQLFIDSALQNDWRAGVFGNPVKLILGNVSLMYDVIFITQHYVLFGPKGKEVEGGSGEQEGMQDEEAGTEEERLADGERRRLLSNR